MAVGGKHRFSGPVTVFQERRLPERATPAGYSALIDAYELQVLLPRTLFAIGERHRITEEGAFLDMPERMIDLLFRFLSQNGGRFSQRARTQEFTDLTDAEAQRVEATYGKSFRTEDA